MFDAHLILLFLREREREKGEQKKLKHIFFEIVTMLKNCYCIEIIYFYIISQLFNVECASIDVLSKKNIIHKIFLYK